MNALLRALSAEALKLRGTLALWMCLIAPVSVVGLLALQWLLQSYGARPTPSPAQAWMMFGGGAIAFWALLMLPLFVTLQAALLAGLEHGNQQWKHLLALPAPRSSVYLAKLLALAGMLVLAMGLLLVLVPIGGWLVGQLQPRSGIAGAPPWAFIATRVGACLAIAMFLVAIHTWLSIRWRSFTVAVSVGMVATVAGFLIGQSRYGRFYPWSMPGQVMASDGPPMEMLVATGLCGAAAVALFGLWDFLRREVA